MIRLDQVIKNFEECIQALLDKLESRIPGTILGLLWWCFVLFRALLGFTWVFVLRHLERELAKKKNKEPPSQSALYLEAVRQAQEVVYKEYVASIPLLIILKKTVSQMPMSDDANLPFFVQPNVDATNRGSSVRRDSVVDSRAKGI